MSSSPRALALALGFATATAMWVVGFLCRLPSLAVPGPVVLGLLLVVLAGGGLLAGRLPGVGVGTAALTGIVASLVNLLVLGSLLTGDAPNAVVPAAVVWLPGSLILGAAVGALGGLVGQRLAAAGEVPGATSLLARVAAAATLFLVLVGGLVTSHDAGLAVVDWPNSYGYNMFLFPLAKMTGGIFYEHAHRLFGSLVGLLTVVLAVRILFTERSGLLKGAAVFAVLFVVGQGILGGLRVTGHFTLSDSPEVTRPSLGLAMVHGVTGQIFFAWMVGIAAAVSRTWRRGWPDPLPPGAFDRGIAATLVVSLLGQLLLGVRLRHTGEGVMTHVTVAVLVVGLASFVALRLLAKYDFVPVFRKTGAALAGHAWTQLILGGLAFVAVNQRVEGTEAGPFEVVVATLHQTVGALLLANAVLAWLWCRRLLPAAPARSAVPSAAGGGR
jgi:cytochrome c oxidase assembly protein subunit 15